MVKLANKVAETLLESTDGLCWDSELGFRAFVGDVFDDKTFVHVTAELLTEVHPLLPALLKETTRNRHKHFGGSDCYIKHVALLENIALWNKPPLTLVDNQGYTHHLRSLKSCEVEPGGVLTHLTVDTYMLEDWYAPGDATPRPLISMFSSDTISCYTVVLDSKHRGWQDRYQEGSELGASASQLVDYMFGTKKPLISVDMKGLDFT